MLGQTISHYRIEKKIGEGGMGVVYRAVDLKLDRNVALKVLSAHLASDADARSRFLREAKAAAALDHANICMVYEIDEVDDQALMAMQLIEGPTVKEKIAERPLKLDEALDIAIQTARGLQAAHEKGIVHRDIKPANLMLTDQGQVKIMDFGIARLSALTRVTATGTKLGTPAYMSPEQTRGETVDHRSDIWSLGVVLYEMLSGRLPFRGDVEAAVSYAILHEEPEPLTALRSGVPVELDRIIAKALAKDTADRYQHADGIVADLGALQRRQAVSSRTASPSARTRKTKRSRLLYAGSLAALVALVSVWLLLGDRFRSVEPVPEDSTRAVSLVVLPLQNRSGDPAEEYLSDGMSDVLTNDLGTLEGVRVVSATSAMRYKDSGTPLQQIARDLNVTHILEGSLLWDRERVRLTVQLIDVGRDQQVWAGQYERETKNVLGMQKELADAIAEEIHVQITPKFGAPSSNPAATAPPHAVDPDAYEAYLQGRVLVSRHTIEDNQRAIEILEQSVQTDPDFAPAWASLARAYVDRFFTFAAAETSVLEPKATAAVERALALDADTAEAYGVRGRLVWTRKNHYPHLRAVAEGRKALSLNPNLDEVHTDLASLYHHIGFQEEAVQEAHRATAINPSAARPLFHIALALSEQLKYQQALDTWSKLPKDLFPTMTGPQTSWALLNLRRPEQAWAKSEEFSKAYQEVSGGSLEAIQALILAVTNRPREAEERLAQAVGKLSYESHYHHTAYTIASVYAQLRDGEQATQWIQKAAENGFPCYPLFARDPLLDPIRSYDGFRILMNQLKTEWEDHKVALGF